MNIKLMIEIHAYCEERLCDEILDENADSCGILGPEVILPLRKNRSCEMQYEYQQNTTMQDVRRDIIRYIQSTDGYVEVAFLYEEERYYCNDWTTNFKGIIQKYLDPHNTGEVVVQLLVCTDAGAVCCEDGIRYFVHSREAGKHNEPHVHVRDTSYEYEASLSLTNGRILAGNFPRKLLKKAQKKITTDQDYFMECWKTQTDGLIRDINHHFGYIKY